MKKHLRFLIAILIMLVPFIGFSQRNCHSMDVLFDNISRNPKIVPTMQSIEQHTQEFIRDNNASVRAVVTIPVVVHVIYNSSTQNISDAQIQSQITVLNQDFRRTNADRTTKWPQAADSEIQFCMANVDPNGAVTTGITRTQTTVSSFSTNDAMKFTAQGGKDAWNTSKYLNIWVCNIGGGILGYAQFPGGGSASTDGVVVGFNYFGTTGTASAPFNKGRTATHEVGHWLNLRHIWGDGPCGTDDFITDTPESDAPNYGCATGHISCGTEDMVQNYMDYSDDACMNLFTAGQKTRMQALFASGGLRSGLLTSTGCSGSTTPQYCAASSSNVAFEWISNVRLNTINNSSTASAGGYGNFTNLTTTLNKGTSYTLTLTPGFASTAYTEYFKVYIDLNGDLDFVDAGENVYTSAGSSTAVSTNITIPSTAITGNVRMRVIMSDAAITSPCGTITYGEVEDYTLNLQTATGTCTAPVGLASSNIGSTTATLSWSAVSGASNYTLQVKTSAATTWTSYTVTATTASLTGLVASTTYNWQVRSNCGTSSSSYTSGTNFTTAAACTDNYETNNTRTAAKTIAVNSNISARIGSSTDVDWFKFSNSSTQRNIRVTLSGLPLDYDLYLYNSAGTLLYSSTNSGTTSETITYNAAPAATYNIQVKGYNRAFSSSLCYTLRATISSTALRMGEEILEGEEGEITLEEINNESNNQIEKFEPAILVYPNPGNSVINVVCEGFDLEKNIQIYDLTGKCIWLGNSSEFTETISIDQLAQGLYHLLVTDKKGNRKSCNFQKM
jgi:hypothetical protein